MSQPTNNPIAKLTHFIEMRMITVPVFNLDGIEYVPARDLVDFAGVNWRTALNTIFTEQNVELYGTRRIEVALYDPNRRSGATDKPLGIAKNMQISEIVCFKLTDAWLYLAKINPSNINAKGNETGAKRLMAIQKEWSNAIHDYETKGIAIKEKESKHLESLFNMYRKADDKKHRELLARKIDKALGYHRPSDDDDQPDMFV